MNPRPLYPLVSWIVWVLALPLAAVVIAAVVVAVMDAQVLPLDHANWWWLVFAVPVAGLLCLYGMIRKRRAMAMFASAQLAPLLTAQVNPSRQAVRSGLAVLAVFMLVVALIGPRWGVFLEKRDAYGVDVVVALDVSRSMLAGDVEPNRLERAKRELKEQLTERSVFSRTNRVGLIAFAGSSSMKVPLTLDHPFFRNALSRIDVGSAPRGGTAIAEAIRSAAQFFHSSPEEAAKIILVVTDGEDHEGKAVEAARQAREEQGATTYTIGVGDPSLAAGAQVPADEQGGGKPLTYDGQIVFSRLNVAGLREIAEAGGGQYAAVGDLRLLVDRIAEMEKSRLTTEERKRTKPRYQWFLVVALVLLMMDTLMSERRRGHEDELTRVWQLDSTE